MKMKKQYIHATLTATLLAIGTPATAQQLKGDTAKVNVAFGTVDKADLMGGVSAVDMVSLTKKNYATYSLEAMEAYVGGLNGGLWNMGDALLVWMACPVRARACCPPRLSR